MRKSLCKTPLKKKGDGVIYHLEETKYWGPSHSTMVAVDLINKYKRRALDLGCGSLRDSKYLYSCGFIVDAIDNEPLVRKYDNFFRKQPKGKFNLIISDYNKHDLGRNKYILIHAQNTLSYNSKNLVKKLINKVYDALQNEGYFSGNLFGIRDSLSKLKRPDMSSYNLKEINKLLNKFEIKKIWETEEDIKTENGKEKHWHTINFVARKIIK